MLLINKNTLKENIQILFHQSIFIFKSENEYLTIIKHGIIKGTSSFCNSSKLILIQFGKSIKKDTISNVKQLSLIVNQKTQQILNGSKIIFKNKFADLLNLEKNIDNMSPKNVIKRGYSITLLNGKSVKAFKDVKQGDILSTIIHEGQILSTVNSTSKPIDQ